MEDHRCETALNVLYPFVFNFNLSKIYYKNIVHDLTLTIQRTWIVNFVFVSQNYRMKRTTHDLYNFLFIRRITVRIGCLIVFILKREQYLLRLFNDLTSVAYSKLAFVIQSYTIENAWWINKKCRVWKCEHIDDFYFFTCEKII